MFLYKIQKKCLHLTKYVVQVEMICCLCFWLRLKEPKGRKTKVQFT